MAESKEDFKITEDEFDRLKQAMKDEQFRTMLAEYAKEIADPENKKKYEEEIIALEQQRGQNVKFLKPESGYVIKSWRTTDQMKIFVNICFSDHVAEASITPGEEAGTKGQHISIPHSLGGPRDEMDKSGGKCIVYDVCFNDKTYTWGQVDKRMKVVLQDAALDFIEQHGKFKVDRSNLKFPKLKAKGSIPATIIRSKTNGVSKQNDLPKEKDPLAFQYPLTPTDTKTQNSKAGSSAGEESLKTSDNEVSKINKTGRKAPEYKVIYRGELDMQNFTGGRDGTSRNRPKDLVVEVALPYVKSAGDLDLDIFEKQLVLDSKKPDYYLDISLPCKVDENLGKAQFDKGKEILSVILPIIYSRDECYEVSQNPLVAEVDNESNGHLENGDESTNSPEI